MTHRLFRTTFAVVAFTLAAPAARAQVQSAAQRRCIDGLGHAGAAVAATIARNFVACVGFAQKGKLAGQTIEQCLAADPHGRLAKAEANAAKVESKLCRMPPSFGPTTAADVTAVFTDVLRVHRVFGDDLDAAVLSARTDKAGAACQMAIARGMAGVAAAKLATFDRCVAGGLRSGAIASAAALEACFEVDPHGHIAGALAKAERAASRRCASTPPGGAAPGECAGAPLAALVACVAQRVDCGVCAALDGSDHVSHGCDRYLDGVATERCTLPVPVTQSVARQWDEEGLAAIRIDLPRPPVHARNLFYLAAAMWDAWAAYDTGGTADAFLHPESPATSDPERDRATAISFAAYRVLSHLYALSVNAPVTQARLDARMLALGLDKTFTATVGDAAAAVGNRVAAAVIDYAGSDGANEAGNYADPTYAPVNDPLIVKLPGDDPSLPGTVMNDPDRWQPLALDFQVSQNDIPIPGKVQVFVGSQWNEVKPFALSRNAPGDLYLDPGAPPQLEDAEFRDGPTQLIEMSQALDPANPAMLDVSPAGFGNDPLGTNDGTGYPMNPVTGMPYAPQLVKRADFGRVIAEFWADGPSSETPPGHWNLIANAVADDPATVKRIGGTGPVVNDLEWDVKTYLAVNGATHDAAIACWGAKRHYDSARPISQIRYMGGLGQSTDPMGPSYAANGLPLVPGLIEVITPASSAPGERHAALAAFVGEVALHVWPGPPADPTTQASGAAWIRAKNWLPYQRDTFVTPAFASYFSGHSTFSRAAAEVLAHLTGSPFFPGGFAEFVAPANAFLRFERGPTTDVRLQWASYYDAADQAGLSRLYGGIHPRVDDFAGRIVGAQVGIGAWTLAAKYFDGTAVP